MSKQLKNTDVEAFLTPAKNVQGETIKYRYTLKVTNRFKKDVRDSDKSNKDLNLLQEAVIQLLTEGKLPAKYRPHSLSGDFKGCMECHIKPDWLLVWQQNDVELVLICIATGSHSYLFG
jgi:mRNA interferase YafQ